MVRFQAILDREIELETYGDNMMRATQAIVRKPMKSRLLFISLCISLAFAQALHAEVAYSSPGISLGNGMPPRWG